MPKSPHETPSTPVTSAGQEQKREAALVPVDPSETLGNVPLNKDVLDQDWKIADGYIAYSSELLRISLLTISGMAAIYLKDRGTFFTLPFIVLVVSAALALLHRFTAIDSMAYHVSSLRRRRRKRKAFTNADGKKIPSDEDVAKDEENLRIWRFKQSGVLLTASATTLILGIVLAAHALSGSRLLH
jgi:hypothetical protein